MPNIQKHIFNRKNLNFILSKLNKSFIQNYDEKKHVLSQWIGFIRSGNIYTQKETSLQGKYLNDIFSDLLNYKNKIEFLDEWNLNQEQLTTIDSKFADGSLGFFSKDSEDVKGFCNSASIDRVKELDYVLTPGRYVGLPDDEDDFDFNARFTALKAEFEEQLKEEEKLNKNILENLGKVNRNELY